jgi:hypothetical protein
MPGKPTRTPEQLQAARERREVLYTRVNEARAKCLDAVKSIAEDCNK